MRQVFISYSSKDIAQAQAVRGVLEQNGITCWMAPADIPGGSNYTKEIPSAIRGCQAFVLMLSDNAQHSHWVLKELDNAVNEGKIILPFQLEDVPLSDEFNFLLTGAQRYDAYQKKTEALQMLVARIKAIIDATPQKEPASQPAPQPEPVPEPQPVKEKKPFFKKPEPAPAHKTAPVSLDGAICPACGSLDVKRLPDKIKPREPKEHILHLGLSLAGAFLMPIAEMFALSVLAFILFMLPLDPDIYEAVGILATVLIIPAAVFGYIQGGKFATEQIRRQRVRKHMEISEHECAACRKKFQVVTVDGAPVK